MLFRSDGASLLGTDTTAPFDFQWSNVPIGSHTLTARATDDGGAMTISTAVQITVNPPPNVPPAVSLTAPANGSAFTWPASIQLSANASDSQGTISKVEFYDGATLLATLLNAPYDYAWNSALVGPHTLLAKVTDNAGAVTTSTTVSITVSSGGDPSLVSYWKFDEGAGASASDASGFGNTGFFSMGQPGRRDNAEAPPTSTA